MKFRDEGSRITEAVKPAALLPFPDVYTWREERCQHLVLGPKVKSQRVVTYPHTVKLVDSTKLKAQLGLSLV